MDSVNKEIWDTYENLKSKVKIASEEKNTNKCLEYVTNLWMFMNRFRNCDLKFYFDEDIYKYISNLNPRSQNKFTHIYKNKKDFRIAFIVLYLNDLGGASVPHRFMLKDFEWQDKNVKNYFLITNFFKKGMPKTDSYDYLKDHIKPEEIKFLSEELTHEQRGEAIQSWLVENNIDFVVAQTCPSTLYALSSNCVPIIGNLTQDCYTFTLGPGFGDITYLVTLDQLFKYKYKQAKLNHYSKIIMLPLHSMDQLDKAEKLDLKKFNIPEDSIVSASSNMWKSFFGDNEYLISGIGELIKKFPFYHHIFIGTPRCLDNLEHYLIKNPELRKNIHYIGPVKNIYRLLKSIDFWVNSFPTSGGTNIEMAKISKPSIDIALNRNLDLHPAEFLCVNETTVISLDEFIKLGARLIQDRNYREDLGKYLNILVNREFEKERLVSERIYKELIIEYQKRFNSEMPMQQISLEKTLDYEKRISLYNAYGAKNWDKEKKNDWLKKCIDIYPKKSFAWIKLIENAIIYNKKIEFENIEKDIETSNLEDYRIQVYLSLGYLIFNDHQKSLDIILKTLEMVKQDQIPLKIALIIYAKDGRLKEGLEILKKNKNNYTLDFTKDLFKIDPRKLIPLYYEY
tara:strand:+ start:8 stop:1879 length:1872 start_codon:yes stop_codon:yes gene_type:complete